MTCQATSALEKSLVLERPCHSRGVTSISRAPGTWPIRGAIPRPKTHRTIALDRVWADGDVACRSSLYMFWDKSVTVVSFECVPAYGLFSPTSCPRPNYPSRPWSPTDLAVPSPSSAIDHTMISPAVRTCGRDGQSGPPRGSPLVSASTSNLTYSWRSSAFASVSGSAASVLVHHPLYTAVSPSQVPDL